MAALTAKEFREKFSGLLGVHEDSTGAVANFTAKMTMQIVTHAMKTANTTTSSDVYIEPVCCVNRVSQLISARFIASESATVSASDYFLIYLKKNVAGQSGNTATVLMATLTGSTALYTPNNKRASHAFTLSATSANLDLASGDVIVAQVSKTSDTVANGGTNQGPGALLPPGGKIILEIQ